MQDYTKLVQRLRSELHTHTKDQEHRDAGWWKKKKKNETEFRSYLHLTSVSPDLELSPEMKKKKKDETNMSTSILSVNRTQCKFVMHLP